MNAVPAIAGFHPDPTICRVGDDYYLATSSFEYFPGVPIFHSQDLLTWQQIGNALDRPSLLAPGGDAASRGIYAPTLRYHNGRFWLVTTNVSHSKGHLLVTAGDPRGPWSEPVFLDGADGIDPDIAWDETGRCYLTWHAKEPAGIVQAAIDPDTGTLLEAPRRLWSGTGLAWPEGPHLYHRDGWWYLLIAEGGTERGHAVSVARSRSITGPFEGAPHNPMFSHRSTTHPVQNCGHADLIERPDGEWAVVYLGTRPRGATPSYHVNGRETFLAGIEWVDGWPVFDETRYPVPHRDHSYTDDLCGERLHPRWISPDAAPDLLVERDGPRAARLRAGGVLAVRAYDPAWSFTATVALDGGAFRLLLRVDDRHWCALDLRAGRVVARLRIGPLESELGTAMIAERRPVTLRIESRAPSEGGPDDVALGVGLGPEYRELAAFDGRYLSTEVASGFTGRVVGLQTLNGVTTLHEVRYTTQRSRGAGLA
ncbi:glycoside hydrolase family 43 protein [Micromonospora sp. CPCC 206061]|uniref:glycoside hydrolase family 43 protein n=1 Tax=Micromonospora sp. CPCC 206061 TaxID=3122410 RepID=UPI002FF06CDF